MKAFIYRSSGAGLFATISLLFSCCAAIRIDSGCKNVKGIDLTPRLTAAIQSAYRLGNQAHQVLSTPPIDQEVLFLGEDLFGPQPPGLPATQWMQAVGRLGALSNVPSAILPGIPTGPNQNANEMYIYCTLDRYSETGNPNQPLFDRSIQAFVQLDDTAYKNYLTCKNGAGGSRVKAITTNETPMDLREPGIPSTMQICPWYAEFIATTDYVTVADVKDGDVWLAAQAFINSILGPFGKTDMDAEALVDHTILHELLHSRLCGVQIQPEYYGWKNCVSAKRGDNNESLAFFALGVEIILNRHRTIGPDGDISVDPDHP